MNQKQIIKEVHDTVQTYCEGCFVYTHFRKTHSQAYAQHFCIKQCTVGQKLKEYGDQLS